jgi:hypothetical protein
MTSRDDPVLMAGSMILDHQPTPLLRVPNQHGEYLGMVYARMYQ